MAVYIDDALIPFRHMKMSHLFADTPEELFDIIDKIGVQRKWYQDKSLPHFDICKSKRELAIQHGAIPITYGTNEIWIGHYKRLKEKFKTKESRKRFLELAKE